MSTYARLPHDQTEILISQALAAADTLVQDSDVYRAILLLAGQLPSSGTMSGSRAADIILKGLTVRSSDNKLKPSSPPGAPFEARIISVPFCDGEPWMTFYFLVSCLAHPRSTRKQKQLYDALILRRRFRSISTKLQRDIYVNEQLNKVIAEGWDKALRTMSAGEILKYQILGLTWLGPATLVNLEQYARGCIGLDPYSTGKYYISGVWKPSWPVIHLAAAVSLYGVDPPNRLTGRIGRLSRSYAASVQVLEIADLIRRILPLYHPKFTDDKFTRFQFVPSKEPIVDESSHQWRAIFRAVDLLNRERERGSDCRARIVRDATGSLRVELSGN
jgi:hypothetical protein